VQSSAAEWLLEEQVVLNGTRRPSVGRMRFLPVGHILALLGLYRDDGKVGVALVPIQYSYHEVLYGSRVKNGS
jgi:hypothetical protein